MNAVPTNAVPTSPALVVRRRVSPPLRPAGPQADRLRPAGECANDLVPGERDRGRRSADGARPWRRHHRSQGCFDPRSCGPAGCGCTRRRRSHRRPAAPSARSRACPAWQAHDMAAAADAVAAAGADFVKLALPPGPQAAETVRGLAALARRVKLVGVLFADMERDDMARDDTLVALMAQCGFYGVMLDTRPQGCRAPAGSHGYRGA